MLTRFAFEYMDKWNSCPGQLKLGEIGWTGTG